MNYNLGARLKSLRKKNRMTVSEVSKLLTNKGMPICMKTIYKWEDNSLSPDLSFLKILSIIYNVGIGSFFNSRISCYTLNNLEEIFIKNLRSNPIYKKIIYLITKLDKEVIKNGNKFIN